jgi:putative tricarboxylic transport membrane protein
MFHLGNIGIGKYRAGTRKSNGPILCVTLRPASRTLEARIYIMMTLINELIGLITLWNITLLSASTVMGIIIGCLPGLTATMGIALLTGLTYGMSQDSALIILMGIYVGAMFGGSISAVLIGIPGTGAAAATVLDGYPLAKKGEGGTALSLALVGSFIGTLFGMILLVTCTPFLQGVALKFTSPELALLSIFGITICGSLTSAGSPLKGWIAGLIGLLASCIGMETMFAYPRYTFDSVQLLGGIAFVPAMIGLFGIPSIMGELARDSSESESIRMRSIRKVKISTWFLLRTRLGLCLKSGVIGVGVGTIPGVGEDVAAWLSYDSARKGSKNPQEFGKGCYDGVIAAETANNACIGGALIPLLCLAIPGSAPTAVLLGAMRLHGIRPGPMLTFEFPNFVAYMSAILFLAALVMRLFGLPACKLAPMLLRIPVHILMPIVGVLSVVGAYALNIRTFDLVIMYVFGMLGYVFSKQGFPAAPIILGLILGPITDENIRRTLQTSAGSVLPFFTRPVCIAILALIVYSFVGSTAWFQRAKTFVRRSCCTAFLGKRTDSGDV